MRQHTSYVFIAVALAWFGIHRNAAASPEDTFPRFPPSCAQQAYEQLARDLEDPDSLASVVRDDHGTWEDKVYEVHSTYGDMMAPSTELLARYNDNRSKPRVSNRQSRRAERLYTQYENKVLYLSPVSIDLGSWNQSPEVIQYKCITETCPAGVVCATLNLRQAGVRFAERFPTFRRLFTQTMRWASEVSHLKGQVARMTKRYQTNERKLTTALENLPERFYVIDDYIARR
jgi:hypothetical protein